MPSLTCAPVCPIPIIGSAVALDFDMPSDRHLAVSPKVHRLGLGRRCGQGQTSAQPMPIPPRDPGDRFPRMSPACPVAELDPGEMIEPIVNGLTHTSAVIV